MIRGTKHRAQPEREAIHVAQRPGAAPLDRATRGYFESRFGHDFSGVRVHADGRAAEAADAVHAHAYTFGRNVVFGAGEYAPATTAGRRLLAHELRHVVQQSGGELRIQRKVKEKAPEWTVEELKKMLDTCDGGLGIWAKAKKANQDKDPKITPAPNAATDTGTGEITIEETVDKCTAVQQLIHELSNLAQRAAFDKIEAEATGGDVSRSDFIRRIEKIEYEVGVKNVLGAFDACKDKWACKTSLMEWARKAKNFDDYFNNFLIAAHKEAYGTLWDERFKAAYEKKHPKK